MNVRKIVSGIFLGSLIMSGSGLVQAEQQTFICEDALHTVPQSICWKFTPQLNADRITYRVPEGTVAQYIMYVNVTKGNRKVYMTYAELHPGSTEILEMLDPDVFTEVYTINLNHIVNSEIIEEYGREMFRMFENTSDLLEQAEFYISQLEQTEPIEPSEFNGLIT